ncbi:flagellar motor stator protein MotA [Duganella sp. sic0402]|uniref:flagellar motor stator protein MotA n=1 Tax=Duganella sp. sic0402 TaxID=2854786 RepID=UPI001C478D2D|nr:flagellar motor stator protein MotA [Duganella sp. sic0402]MBV7534374.1 flagellar motor stator protein MotA [Duganella sp. sic0402]
MSVLLGIAIVLVGIFGGFVLEGGHLGPLYQPFELMMIAGGALGAFVIANDGKSMRATAAALPTLFQTAKQTNALYLDLLSLLYEILTKIRKEGLMAVESDIDAPQQSPIFSKFPAILADHHLTEFITDYLRLMVSGNMDPYQIENLMDNEIEVHHQDGEVPIHAINKLADGLPAFGIIAAVMGVVHTMGSVGMPPAELGNLIAAALVGTFLGILLAYGVVSPVANLLERKLQESTKIFQCVKVTLIASLNGYAPTLSVEFGRKVISAVQRPSFSEMETHFKQQKSK